MFRSKALTAGLAGLILAGSLVIEARQPVPHQPAGASSIPGAGRPGPGWEGLLRGAARGLHIALDRHRGLRPQLVAGLPATGAGLLGPGRLFAPRSATSGLKPALRGLLDRAGQPPAPYLPVLSGYVVNVHWADIQPVAGGPLTAGNIIDQSIATVRRLNAAGHHLGLKLRLFAGIWAPSWAKSIDGPPVAVCDPTSGACGTVGRFWTADFGLAYAQLEALLAARYDGVPELREVVMSRCTTIYAEPFIRDMQSPTTVHNLLAAGYTVAADEACHAATVQAHQVWRTTRSDLSFNPYQQLSPGGSGSTDEAYTQAMMGYCRQALGSRCILENNSVRVPVQSGGYPSLYAALRSMGPGIALQTAAIQKVGSLAGTLQYAIGLGASSVELPSGYTGYAPGGLAPLAAGLAANPAP